MVFETTSGAVRECAVGFGVKYSTVQYNVLPAVEVRVKLCPFTVPIPVGNKKASPLTICFINGPLTKEVELPPAGITAEGEVLIRVNLFAEVVFIIPFASNS
jgi:hypothetical protein